MLAVRALEEHSTQNALLYYIHQSATLLSNRCIKEAVLTFVVLGWAHCKAVHQSLDVRVDQLAVQVRGSSYHQAWHLAIAGP